MIDDLFNGAYPDPPIPTSPGLSASRLRTTRQHQQIFEGIHPLTRGPACPDKGTCGDCAHRMPGRHPKCALGPISRGAATDVRAFWPACTRFTPDQENPT